MHVFNELTRPGTCSSAHFPNGDETVRDSNTEMGFQDSINCEELKVRSQEVRNHTP
jgi:hypothetical protein